VMAVAEGAGAAVGAGAGPRPVAPPITMSVDCRPADPSSMITQVPCQR
jgi:hypothetical protein